MFSTEQRKKAIETFIKFDHSYADTVTELGYPTRATLRNWWKEYESSGEIPVGKGHHRKSKYTDDQARCAVGYSLEHGKSLSRTMCALGYPKGSDTLRGWIDEIAPAERKRRGPNPKKDSDREKGAGRGRARGKNRPCRGSGREAWRVKDGALRLAQ